MLCRAAAAAAAVVMCWTQNKLRFTYQCYWFYRVVFAAIRGVEEHFMLLLVSGN